MATFRRLLQNRQVAFVYFAVAFGALQYVISGATVTAAVLSGLGFAILMTLWVVRRDRRKRQSVETRPP